MRKSVAIQHFGSQKKLAAALGLKAQSTISEWPDPIPLGWALLIEKIARSKKLRVDLSIYRNARS